jgi:ATP-dependent helicase YprA (DUF1998 family)
MNKLLIIPIIGLMLLIAFSIGVILTKDTTTDNEHVNTTSINMPNQNTQDSTWHKVSSHNGVGDNVITLNSNGNKKIKIVSTAMPLLNYDENYMSTVVIQNGYSFGSSELSWGENSAIAIKTANIEFLGSGTYYIYVTTYDLDYWNVEIYEWY